MTDVELLDEEIDGRRRRSADSRARIVAAMLGLVAEGDTTPSAENVATRAQVGLRTVFRHFRDMESLYAEMSAHVEGELRAMIAEPLRGPTWQERLMEIGRRRARVFEKIGPYQRAAVVHRRLSAVLAADHARLVTSARAIIEQALPAEVRERPILADALDLVLSFETWDRLRTAQGLSVEAATGVIAAIVQRQIAA
ncbi:MAG TPA: TetR/AcrR family transcriptional regulator [Caulobacteraceae bacterium]|nr:TetR/AcrR family transcriptional regulator [Caulobacteraceae bacterium]